VHYVNGRLRLIEIASGLDVEKDIIDWMEFRPLIADNLKTMNLAIFSEEWGELRAIIEAKRKIEVDEKEPVLV
jgi:propionate CoA-transferase